MPSARHRKTRLAHARGAAKTAGPLLVPLPAPRNPMVVPAARRKAGAHGSSKARQRQDAAREVRQALRELGRKR